MRATLSLLLAVAATGATGPAATAAAPALPAPPPSCALPLVQVDPFAAGDPVRLGPADDHYQPAVGAEGGNALTFVHGERGADCLVGSVGYDYLDGGPGDDRLVGGRGADELHGGPGNDTLITGEETGASPVIGVETIDGGAGDDVAAPAPGGTMIALGPGNDRVVTTDGSNGRIDCGSGTDTVVADGGDLLKGCEHVVRRRVLRTRLTVHADGGLTLSLRSPWARRANDGIIGWHAEVSRPHHSWCSGMRQTDATHGRRVVLRLRRGHFFPPCPGRWRIQLQAVFEESPDWECDGGSTCATNAADVGSPVAVTVRRR